MDIIVKSKNCDVPPRIKQEALGKAEHATRFFDRLLGMEMVFAEEHNPRIPERAVVEVTARTKGHHIRAEGRGADHREAVDAAMARFERQLARYKARLMTRRRRAAMQASENGHGRGAVRPVAVLEAEPGQVEHSGPRIVRTKRFDLQPMLPEDAAWHLELLGHDFYVFHNAATDRCNVLYRRNDGDFGLIDTA